MTAAKYVVTLYLDEISNVREASIKKYLITGTREQAVRRANYLREEHEATDVTVEEQS